MTKTLPWTRLLAEGVVVVASILLALAAEAWWSGRSADAARLEWLAALQADFETNASEALFYAERSARDRRLAQRFVFMSADEAALIPEDSTWQYLLAIWRPNPAPLNTEAIVAALEAAPVLAAEDDQLRRAIGAWRIQVSYLAQFDARLWETQDLTLSALADYPVMQRALAEQEWGGNDRTLPGAMLGQAREDNDIVGLATMKAMFSMLQIHFLEEIARTAQEVGVAAAATRTR